jgi:diguanylate cyclase (GGDEF)-like protein/PAS domain S-box-containing protein
MIHREPRTSPLPLSPRSMRAGELPVRVRFALLAAAVGALTVLVIERHALYVGAGAGGDALGLSVIGLGAAGAFARASCETRLARLSWLLLGLGISTYGVGSAAFFIFQHSALAAFPTTGDLLWLTGFALILSGLVLRLQITRPAATAVMWTDCTIVAFLVASLAAGAFFRSVLRTAVASRVVVSGQLTYPVIDLVLLALALSSYWFSGRRMEWETTLLAGGFAILLAADTIFLYQVAAGAYKPGTMLDTSWPAAMLLIGLAATGPRAIHARHGSRVLPATAIPLLGGVAAAILLIETQLSAQAVEVRIALVSLAALTLASVLLRLLFTLRENARLLQTERATRETAQAAEADLMSVIDASPTPICVVDTDAVVRVWNLAAERCSGYTRVEVVGGPPPIVPVEDEERVAELYLQALSGKHLDGIEIKLRRRSGEPLDIRFSTAPLRGPEEGVVILFEDITEQRRQTEAISYLASHDTLTGLPNRRTFDHELERALARRRRGHRSTLLMIDVDDFKRVNDTAGHAAGDRLLHDLAHAMQQELRPGDTLARLSGDEFAAIIDDADTAHAKAAASRLIRAARTCTATTISAGLYGLRAPDTADAALRHADEALYDAKHRGKDQLRAWTHDDRDGSDYATG